VDLDRQARLPHLSCLLELIGVVVEEDFILSDFGKLIFAFFPKSHFERTAKFFISQLA